MRQQVEEERKKSFFVAWLSAKVSQPNRFFFVESSMLRKYVNILKVLMGVSTNELITRCSFAYSGKPAGQDLLAAGERNAERKIKKA